MEFSGSVTRKNEPPLFGPVKLNFTGCPAATTAAEAAMVTGTIVRFAVIGVPCCAPTAIA